jgi:hypothetical protein
MAGHADLLGDLLQLGQQLAGKVRPFQRLGIHYFAPSFSSFWSFFQS